MGKKKPIKDKKAAPHSKPDNSNGFMTVDPDLDSSIIPEVFKKKTEEVNKFIKKHGLPA